KVIKKQGRPSTEYDVTMYMAKSLAMVEHTEKGEAARRYFIECEEIAMQSLKADLSLIAEPDSEFMKQCRSSEQQAVNVGDLAPEVQFR
ncbi:MAG: hypothetical protein V3T31_06220, partial [candidate division Zixibacteria bacterium]